MKVMSLTAAFFGIFLTSAAFAADSYTVDPAHAWIGFKTNHAGWAKAHGTFNKVSGTLSFDKTDVTKSSVDLTIDAASIDTNHEKRDTHLKSPDFLNTAEFPTITFKSKSIEKTGEKTAKVTGDMTVIGTTKPVVLDVVWNAESPLPWDKSKIKTGFSATGSINGADFGLSKMASFGIGPEIELDIDIEANKN